MKEAREDSKDVDLILEVDVEATPPPPSSLANWCDHSMFFLVYSLMDNYILDYQLLVYGTMGQKHSFQTFPTFDEQTWWRSGFLCWQAPTREYLYACIIM
jgi:hypothetical protein